MLIYSNMLHVVLIFNILANVIHLQKFHHFKFKENGDYSWFR